MKKLKTINFSQFFIVYILIQPILDVLTSLFVRNISSSLTIGVFVRTIFMAITVIYSLVATNKKHKTKLLIYYILLAVYSIIYTILCISNTGTSMILVEMKGLVKTLYLPVVLASLFALYKSEKIKINPKHLVYSLFGYCLIIVVAKYFNLGYSSYVYGSKEGTVGLFFAANEIGAILAILSPFLFITNRSSKQNNFYLLVYILLICSVLELGTKVPFLAFMALLVINIIINIYRIFILKEKTYTKNVAIGFISLVFIFLIIGITPIGKNLNINFIAQKQEPIINENIENNIIEKPSENTVGTFQGDMISGRGNFFNTNYKEYTNSKSTELLFGTSYLTVNNNNLQEKKLVEMDFFDVFFNHGLIGFVLILGPLFLLTIYIIIKNLKYFKNILKEPERLIYIYAYFIGLAISFISGHTLVAPAVSIFVIISLILNIQLIETKE